MKDPEADECRAEIVSSEQLPVYVDKKRAWRLYPELFWDHFLEVEGLAIPRYPKGSLQFNQGRF